MRRELSILVVDDEALARKGIRALLERENGVTDIREAANAGEAIRAIAERSPDIVFLDIQMPRLGGFEVIEAVGAERMPAVVFVTAHDEHALRAFEVHAVDYLLKPIDPARFRDALDRASRAALSEDVSAIRASLAALVPTMRVAAPASQAPPSPDRRLRVRNEGRIVLVEPREIDWVESAGNYVQLHLRGSTLRHRATMDELHAELGPAFVRIRRATLVRSAAVRSCVPVGKGSYNIFLHDGTRLESSRYFRQSISPLVDG